MNMQASIHHRQSQSVVMTTQVIQSIKILQFSQEQLQAFISEQAERNPLIECVSGGMERSSSSSSSSIGTAAEENRADLAKRIQTNSHDSSGDVRHQDRLPGGRPDRGSSLKGVGGAETPNLEEYCAATVSLREHLCTQAAISFRNSGDRAIALEIVGSLEPDGYLRRDVSEIAYALGTSELRVETVLKVVQTFEPTGVAARSLEECLGLQLKEKNLLSPAMTKLLENLPLLANYEIQKLSKACGVQDDKVMAMAAQIRNLDPRPGRQLDCESVPPALPDVIVTRREDGSFGIEINTDYLPRILVDREYYAEVSAVCTKEAEKKYVTDCMKDASWLERSLDQRARTILKVAAEIVTKQRDFLRFGVEHIRPLNLRDVAEAIGMHESTVCRAISGKFLLTSRGMFELKFFFGNAIASSDGSDDFSAETIRHKIKLMIGAEKENEILSDDGIVTELRGDGIEIARRTVAKYREVMGIPSSQQRRRQKMVESFPRQDQGRGVLLRMVGSREKSLATADR